MKERVNIRISREAYERLLRLRFRNRKARATIVQLVDKLLGVRMPTK